MLKFVIVCGTSFAGKSTLAHLLAGRFGYAEVDVDETKAGLFGVAVDDRALGPSDWARIYDETDRLIEVHLSSGRSILDASRNFTKDERQRAAQICRLHRADLLTVHVDTPEQVTRKRLLANRRTRVRRDVTDEDFASILASWEPPTADERALVFRYDDDPAEWMNRHASALAEEPATHRGTCGDGTIPIIDHLRTLEESLWVAETRFDRAYMEPLLAPGFFEIGCSGRVYTREQILAMPFQVIAARLPLDDIGIQSIADGVVQITYTSHVAWDEQAQMCRRSSIWVATAGGWRLRFHQATPMPQ